MAPVNAQGDGLTILVVALGGLAVAGGIVYLAEKLINLSKRVALMVFELIAEKYKEHRYAVGMKAGRDEERQAWQAWYERQQAALRAGRPFDEPPPGYSPEPGSNGKEPD